jgi:aminopeptidase 2
MCKVHGQPEADGEIGGVDVTMGREILPANVIPKHYDLTLEPDFENFTFEGTVIVDLDVVEDSTSISLNTLEIDVHSTRILSGSQTIRLVISRQRSSLPCLLEQANPVQFFPRSFPQ